MGEYGERKKKKGKFDSFRYEIRKTVLKVVTALGSGCSEDVVQTRRRHVKN